MIRLEKLMNTKVPMKIFALSFSLFLVACASSGVYPLAGDKLMISKNTAKVGVASQLLRHQRYIKRQMRTALS